MKICVSYLSYIHITYIRYAFYNIIQIESWIPSSIYLDTHIYVYIYIYIIYILCTVEHSEITRCIRLKRGLACKFALWWSPQLQHRTMPETGISWDLTIEFFSGFHESYHRKNHRKMGKSIGKWWFNGVLMGFHGIYPLVIEHTVENHNLWW